MVTLITDTQSYAYYGKLDEAERELGDAFIRLHQRYLARAEAIERIEGSTACIRGESLPISRANHQRALLAFARNMLGG